MQPFDHLVIALIAVGYPVYVLWRTPAVRRRIVAGQVALRRREYLETMAWLWSLAALGLWAWQRSGRPFALLGLHMEGGWLFWLGLGVTAAVAVFFYFQARSLGRDADAREAVRHHYEAPQVVFFLPHTWQELRLFLAVSVTAGITEEILYRGFLIWYLAELVGPLGGLFGSSLVFGWAHFYQGFSGAWRTALVGLVLGIFYLWTGSLWVPMLLHIAIDIYSGVSAWRVLGERGRSSSAPVSPSSKSSAVEA